MTASSYFSDDPSELRVFMQCSMEGGAPAYYRRMKVILTDRSAFDDIMRLKLASLHWMGTGRYISLPCLVRDCTGLLWIAIYRKWVESDALGPAVHVDISHLISITNQARAERIFDLQVELHSATLDCALSDCRLAEDRRGVVVNIFQEIFYQGVRGDMDIDTMRRRMLSILRLLTQNPHRFSPSF